MTRALKKITDDTGAELPKNEMMVLSDCKSPWYSNIFVSVAKEEVEGAEVEKISGVFMAKAFEGDYSNIGNWVKEMKELVKEIFLDRKGNEEKKMEGAAVDVDDLKLYFYYPTCPKCAKEYGKNYVVVMAKIS